MLKTVGIAALVAGTLDILSAFMFAGIGGVGPMAVLAYVASGPFGDRALEGSGWGLAGLAVHFSIMLCMAAAYAAAAKRFAVLRERPLLSGLLYGVGLWLVMYWVVKPLRWPDAPLPHTPYGIANALFSHCVLVGMPIALIVARRVRPRSALPVVDLFGSSSLR